MSVSKVTTYGLSNNAVTTFKINDDAVTTEKINFENALVPVGGIIMWSGSIATIPTGWALCNGSNGTPNLTSKFIVGAASDSGTGEIFNSSTGETSGIYAPGNTGGSTAHKLTVDEIPSHAHRVGTRDSTADGGGIPQNEFAQNYPSVQNIYVTSQSVGGDDYHENRPPYYALAFIMRVS
jgi:microcystin-dependent protein